MRLLRRPDAHARFRELIGQQMDLPLHLDEAWQLSVHLSRCAACRAVEREYSEQRRALRRLPAAPVPRDLWARTAAALDLEIAGDYIPRPAGRPSADRRSAGRRAPADRRPRAGTRRQSGASIAVSLAVFGAAALLAMTQWPITDRPSPTRLLPTPFAVPGYALAYISAGPQGMSIYRTSVDHACPVSASDCVNEPRPPSAMSLSYRIEPSSLALSPSGRQLAITGRDSDRSSVFAIVLIPELEEREVVSATLPPATRAAPSSGQASQPSAAVDSPVDPTIGPSAAPGLKVVAILENAQGAGAPPAWSDDGQVLAFSAMPADGRSGPDLYVWRLGNALAQRLTSDQSTYFASWSDTRIVVSRVTAAEGGLAPVPVTMVIDPATGEERAIEDAPLWLPKVNRPGTHAIAWHGRLGWRGSVAVAEAGALYAVDWAALDPYAGAQEAGGADPDPTLPLAEPSPVLSEEPSHEPSDAGSPTGAQPTAPPVPTVLLTLPPMIEPTTEPVAGSEDPTAEPPAESGDPAVESPGAEQTPPPPTPEGQLATYLEAIEPARDPSAQPVLDWEARWSPDGQLAGLWIADAPGSSWGRLAVLSLDPSMSSLVLDQPMLGPTLARRSFTLSGDRLAWVAPADHSPEGELRVTTWGPDGFGIVRVAAPELEGPIAPF
ncbi:hypothetical protein BH23CHL7_BH23CHL7_09560 [soil metagenome]